MAYVAARQLGLAAPPSRLGGKAAVDAAAALVKDFAAFAEEACGCAAPANRAHLRRAVFQAGSSLPLGPFIDGHLGGDASSLEAVSRMECPVTLPDKTMLQVKVPESAPRRIVFASKTLRRHFSLTETQTCRGCLKRQRCKHFKAPMQDEEGAGIKHVTRVLFGMAQYSRAHLQEPKAYPFFFTGEQLDAARVIMKALRSQLAEADHPLYRDIEVADRETAKSTGAWLQKRQLEKTQRALEERVLSLPQWMRETLRPVPGPGMTKYQRELLERHGVAPARDPATGGSGSEALGQRTGEEEWVEEGGTPGEPAGPALLFQGGLRPEVGGDSAQPGGAAQRPLIVVDGVEANSAPKRFEHLEPRWEERKVARYNSVAGGPVENIVLRAGNSGPESLGAPRVDLDAVGDEALAALLGPDAPGEGQTALHGGYTIADLLKADAPGGVPSELLRYVSVSPHALEGVHEYRVGPAPKPIDPKIVEDLWERAAAGQDELPFLRPVPFDAGPGRSGGALPPGRLPQDQLLDAPEPMVPPPERAPRGGRRPAARVSADEEEEKEEEENAGPVLVMLDEPAPGEPLAAAWPRPLAPEDFAADEALLAQAQRTSALERLRAAAPALGNVLVGGAADDAHRPSFSGAAAGGAGAEGAVAGEGGGGAAEVGGGAEDAEDLRFAAWSSRPRPRAIGVVDPALDFSPLGDASRLDHVGRFDAEGDVPIRQGRPLPEDDEFASAFRRPLAAPLGDGADPLGAAAPGVDIAALKASVAEAAAPAAGGAEATRAGLRQDSRFVYGGSIKFPKIPQGPPEAVAPRADSGSARGGGGGAGAAAAAAATRRLPPQLGRLRQARTEDLSDLFRPGGDLPRPMRSPRGGSRGGPRGAAPVGDERQPPQGAAEARAEENAQIAAQQLLGKQIKQEVKKRFSRAKGRRPPGAVGAPGAARAP